MTIKIQQRYFNTEINDLHLSINIIHKLAETMSNYKWLQNFLKQKAKLHV